MRNEGSTTSLSWISSEAGERAPARALSAEITQVVEEPAIRDIADRS